MIKCLLFSALIGLTAASPLAQPKLLGKGSKTYQVGERIDPATLVLGKDQTPVRLVELIRPQTKVAVLILFGGALAQPPAGEPFRGSLWCQDSFDDLGIQRALLGAFESVPEVQFIPVAVPPVYTPERYGFGPEAFLELSESSPQYHMLARMFIDLTENQRVSGLLPFESIYYDPRFLLAQNPAEKAPFGSPHPWQGRLRWKEDARRYGTPIIWLLGPGGEILQAPFHSNEYDGEPPQVLYGFAELKEAVARLAGRQ